MERSGLAPFTARATGDDDDARALPPLGARSDDGVDDFFDFTAADYGHGGRAAPTRPFRLLSAWGGASCFVSFLLLLFASGLCLSLTPGFWFSFTPGAALVKRRACPDWAGGAQKKKRVTCRDKSVTSFFRRKKGSLLGAGGVNASLTGRAA